MCSEMKYQKCNKIINAFILDFVNIIERQFTDVQSVICGDKIQEMAYEKEDICESSNNIYYSGSGGYD